MAWANGRRSLSQSSLKIEEVEALLIFEVSNAFLRAPNADKAAVCERLTEQLCDAAKEKLLIAAARMGVNMPSPDLAERQKELMAADQRISHGRKQNHKRTSGPDLNAGENDDPL